MLDLVLTRNRRALLGLVSVLLLTQAACDSQKDDPGIELNPQSTVLLSNGYLETRVQSSGNIFEGILTPVASNPDLRVSFVNSFGLWMAGIQNGISANIGGSTSPRINKFEFERSVADGGGLYLVTSEDISAGIKNWPSDLGAPAHPDGSPKLYGDKMVWGLFSTSDKPNVEVQSFSGINVGMTAFMFEGGPLNPVLFIRYEISNESSIPVLDLHLGIGGDIDLWWSDPQMEPCGGMDWGFDQTGYDLAKHYSYTYIKPHPSDADLPSGCYGAMIGYSILDMHSEGGLSQPKLAHRLLTKGHVEPFFDFAEAEIQNSEQVQYALQGLSATGRAMVDPTTGATTAFAYTGDPLSGTGWLDTRKDVRSLQSIAPFDLMPGDTRVMTVAFFTTLSASFTEGMTELKGAFDALMRRRESWDH